jgi:ABC-type multidrug transport system ATPase subunit
VSAAIELRAVGQRTRSGGQTLRDVSLSVGQGELVSIIGGSDSGKTVLLELMGGVRSPITGAVSRVSRNIGYVGNGEAFPPLLPLKRALSYTAALRDVPADAVLEALATVDLSAKTEIPVRDLTPEERRRAALAAGLLSHPELLLLEDPTSGLGPAGGAELLRLLRSLTDGGLTVVLTAGHPAEAEQTDKVAAMASGGHLAFFGTPDDALDYFGADSINEIYERLAGVGDPVAAWSRRFSRFSRTPRPISLSPVISPVWHTAPSGLSGHLYPDGLPSHFNFPHYRAVVNTRVSTAGTGAGGTAGSASGRFDDDDAADKPDDLLDEWRSSAGAEVPGDGRDNADGDGADASAEPVFGGAFERVPRPLRHWALLVARHTDIISRQRWAATAVLAGPLLMALVFLSALFRIGASTDGRFDIGLPLLWVAFAGFYSGLACGLPQVVSERPVLRAERLAGLGVTSYVLSKVAVLLPPVVIADAVFLALLDAAAGQPGFASFGPVYLTLVLCSAAALGLGLVISTAVPAQRWAALAMPAACFPALLAAYGVAEGHAGWIDWAVLAVFTVGFFVTSVRLLTREQPAVRKVPALRGLCSRFLLWEQHETRTQAARTRPGDSRAVVIDAR